MTDNAPLSLALIIDAIEQIRLHACSSYADVAMRLPEVWSMIRAHGPTRRTIAQSCGWPVTLSREEIESQPADNLGVSLLNFGSDNAVGLWQSAPRTCHLMHVNAKLDDAYAIMASSVGKPSENETWILDDRELMACGFLECGLRFDLCGVKRTLAVRSEHSMRSVLPLMPGQGCTTAGGRVFDIPSLIVARVLEYSQVPFDAPDAVRDLAARQALPGGFHLTNANVVLGFGKRRYSRVEQMLFEFPRVVLVDDGLLESAGWMVGYLFHIVESLAEVGVRADVCLENDSVARFLQPLSPSSAVGPLR